MSERRERSQERESQEREKGDTIVSKTKERDEKNKGHNIVLFSCIL